MQDVIMYGMEHFGVGLPELYDMTWQEFVVRSEVVRRSRKEKEKQIKYLAYHSLIGPHVDPKSLPKSFAKFIGEAPKVSGKAISFYQQEMKKFRELQKNGKPKTTS